MKAKHYLLTLAAFSALATSPLALAAEAEVKAQANPPDVSVKANVDQDRADRDANTHVVNDAAAIRARGVQKTNKASGLLGMEVHNNQNEKLGEIKDLVLDLGSGKVSYAVLAVGGFLGIGEKLLAIPPEALSISDDRTFLKLDADKAKIQAAPGFAATNWPRVDDPEVRSSRYWSTGSAVGGPAATETRSERDHGVKSEVKVDTGTKDKLYTDAKENRADSSLRARTDANTTRDYERVRGVIRSVDAKNHLLTVQTDTGDMRVFTVDDQANLRMGKQKTVRLNDFKPGYNVSIDYDKNGNRLTAYTIEKSDTP
jgi:sporulation protein YlmC with PRC-barrel domain